MSHVHVIMQAPTKGVVRLNLLVIGELFRLPASVHPDRVYVVPYLGQIRYRPVMCPCISVSEDAISLGWSALVQEVTLHDMTISITNP